MEPVAHPIGQLTAALVRAHARIQTVTKNAANPHFKSNYADLAALLDVAKPVFAEEGLALVQVPGEIEGENISLVWMLVHTSGQSMSGKTQLPLGKNLTAQAAGSAITYARRYQWAAIAGLAQVDDDGNEASGKARPGKAPAPDTYAATTKALISRVELAESLADLEALRDEVAELGDQAVADVYVAKKKLIKGGKK